MTRACWLLLLLLAGFTAAQPELIVDGQNAGTVDQHTVAGISYAGAHQLSGAIGAELELLDSSVSLRMAGRMLQLRIVADPERALDAADAAALDGRPVESTAALRLPNGSLLLPVKTVAQAFGGHVTVLSGTRDAVEVRLPIARLSALRGSASLVSIDLSAPVPYTVYYNEQLSTLQVSFARSEANGLDPVSGSGPWTEAWLLSSAGQPELRISLTEGSSYQLHSERLASGWRFSVAVSGQRAATGAPSVLPPPGTGQLTVLLDPPADRQLLDLALAVASRLREDGLEVLLTRQTTDAAEVSLLAADRASLYMQLGTAPDGISLYWLADAADAAGLRRAAELSGGDQAAVERLRRQLLLGEYGSREQAWAQALSLNEDLPGAQLSGLPLTQLAVSAGHGLLLRIGAGQVQDPELPQRVAAGIIRALGTR